MYKKLISYTDFNGNAVVDEALYFNLNSREMTNLMAKWNTPDLPTFLMEVANRAQPNEIFPVLEEVLLTAYGERSTDGKRFNKSPQIRQDFENSIAYAEYFEEFFNNPEEVALFIQSAARVSDRTKNAKNQNGIKTVENGSPIVADEFAGLNSTQILALLEERGALTPREDMK